MLTASQLVKGDRPLGNCKSAASSSMTSCIGPDMINTNFELEANKYLFTDRIWAGPQKFTSVLF